MAKKLSNTEIKAVIAREIDNALGLDGTKLAQARRDALKYYEGQPFGNEQAGRSQVVSRDVLEVVEWSLPALLRIFMAGDDVVRFEAQGPEDEQAAKQATEYINFVFQRDNPGFQITYNWFKDALLSKNGFVKVYWEKRKVTKTAHYTGLTKAEYDALKEPQSDDDTIEVLEEKEHPDLTAMMAPPVMPPMLPMGMPGMNGGMMSMPAPQMLYDCTLKLTSMEGKVCIDCVPPEEVLIARRASDIETAPMVIHHTPKTRSELKTMGFDPALVDSIPQDTQDSVYNTEKIQRRIQDEETLAEADRTDPAAQEIELCECFINLDEDGDGIAELRKITFAGLDVDVILDDEEADEKNLVSITPMPMPHKFFGMSLADMVMDLQLLKSVIWRQSLDNLYLSNTPRHGVVDAPGYTNTNTIDDLLLSRPGGIIRMSRPDAVVPFVTPFVADKAFDMLAYVDEIRENRTGVSKRNQGISPDDLNKTAAGLSMLQQAAAQRIELIARVFAETGMKTLFRKILGLVTRYQDKARTIKLRNQWVAMDPRQWQNSFDLSVSVGLGTGNKDQMLGHLLKIGELQAAIVQYQGGLEGPLITAKNVHKTMEALVQNSGFRNAEEFVTDPANAQPKPPQPNPEMMKMQGQMALKKQEIDGKKEVAMMEAQIKAQLDQAKMQHEAMLAEQASRHRQELEAGQAKADIAVQALKAEFSMQLEQMKAGLKIQETHTKFIADRLGIQAKDEKAAEQDSSNKELNTNIGKLVETMNKPRRVLHIRGKDGKIAESRTE